MQASSGGASAGQAADGPAAAAIAAAMAASQAGRRASTGSMSSPLPPGDGSAAPAGAPAPPADAAVVPPGVPQPPIPAASWSPQLPGGPQEGNSDAHRRHNELLQTLHWGANATPAAAAAAEEQMLALAMRVREWFRLTITLSVLTTCDSRFACRFSERLPHRPRIQLSLEEATANGTIPADEEGVAPGAADLSAVDTSDAPVPPSPAAGAGPGSSGGGGGEAPAGPARARADGESSIDERAGGADPSSGSVSTSPPSALPASEPTTREIADPQQPASPGGAAEPLLISTPPRVASALPEGVASPLSPPAADSAAAAITPAAADTAAPAASAGPPPPAAVSPEAAADAAPVAESASVPAEVSIQQAQ